VGSEGHETPRRSVIEMTGPQSPTRVFAYAVAERAELYLRVVDALVAAKERFRLQLRPAEVVDELAAEPRPTPDEVRSALEQLADWGNVTRFYDSAAPESLAEFYAKRFLYQLTPEGVAAHAGVQAVQRAGLDRGGRLSSVLLPGIVERLEAVKAEAGCDPPDGSRLYASLVDLFGAFAELADNAARYMSDLAVETAEIAADDERFVNYKRAVFVYLNTFVARFTELVPRIVALVAELDPRVPQLFALAAVTDAAPTLAGDDAGPLDTFSRRWAGVRAWFVAEGDEPSVAEALRVAMLEALNRILTAVARLHDRHLRRASREADFDALARWFVDVDDDAAAHQLWDGSFGTFAARHFSAPAGDEEVERRRSFWDAAPAEVAPRLRATGTRAGPGRPGTVADYSAAKAARVEAVRAARRRAAAAVERLDRRTPARLSELGALDGDEFAQLLDVLAAALAVGAKAETGRRGAVTPLARVTVEAAQPPDATAEVKTPSGVLHAPDLLVDVVAVARRGEAGGAATTGEAEATA
jgi:uncharacterized protein (TIGR02677 family)